MVEEAKTEAQFVEVTFKHALKVWWSFFWRTMLCGLVVGFVLGFIMGFLGMKTQDIQKASELIGFILGIPIGIVVMKIILKKRFSGFRIALVKE